ncbi:peptidase [Alteromonas sediminis]|uniref:Peptidase n=1 Tax=Alteromonas sediminis TaxID=2259342 RepID=A0A3N5Z8S7_9ALTE|nr:S8 family serine peptidase [Alteromonas sediminis]RPJ67324.1 peptidase [Alteromonas sediminis]
MRKTLLRSLVIAVSIGQLLSPTTQASSIRGHTVEQSDALEAMSDVDVIRKYSKSAGRNSIRVIIELDGAPLAFASNLSLKNDEVYTSSTAQAYQSLLQDQHQAVLTNIKSIDTDFSADFQYFTAFNGFSGAIDNGALDELIRLPGIKAVHPDIMYHSQMDASLDLINSMPVWEQLGGREQAGKGIRVAIIDSGIRPENPLFSGEGFDAPASNTLPDDDYCSSEPSFCNNKLIVARFAQIANGFDVHVDEYTDSPLGFNGHGTHVAGTAVGNYGVTARRDGSIAEISGVAPAAYLMVYKGLYATNDNPTRSSATSSMLLSMLEAALRDGADIINNSWGSGAGESPAGSVYETVLASIREAGIVNVFAAGNSGPSPVTIGCPACSDDVLTVGNTTTDRLFANEVSILGSGLAPIPAIFSGPVAVTSPITAPIISSSEISPANLEGCEPFSSSTVFSGAIALISRGTCTFATKIANAEAAGARAVLIYNQAGRGEAPFVMGGLSPSQTIPSLMMPASPGIELASYLRQTNESVSATIGNQVIRTTSDALGDIMAESSARGPGGDSSFLKPNLVAPGSRIFSAESPDAPDHIGEQFSFKTGTSMAAPHVAGAAALLKQLHPNWSVRQIESALVSSSVRSILKEDAVTPADNFDMGAGRLDVERASTVEVTFDEISLVEAKCFLACDLTFTATNTSDSPVVMSPETFFDDPTVIARVTPNNLTIAPGQSSQITLTVDVSLATVSEWVLGGINWQDTDSATSDYFIPVAVFPVTNDENRLFTANASVSSAAPGEAITFSVTGINEEFSGAIEIKTRIDNKYELAPESLFAQSNGTALPVTWDSDTREIIWQGDLALGSLQFSPSNDIAQALADFDVTGYFSMSEVTQPLVCSGQCDDAEVEVIHAPITYFGSTYTSMKVSSNGFVSMGRSSGSVTSPEATPLPNGAEPNGVVAPFWVDLDLDGTDEGDSGSGEMYAVELATGHFVVEWKNAQIKGHPDLTVNVQLWFNFETGAVNFVYGPMSSPTLQEASQGIIVGAENAVGNVGVTYASQTSQSITGVLPAEGLELKLTSDTGGMIDISFTGTVLNPADFMDDTASLSEDTSATITVLANDANTNILNVSEMRTLTDTLRTVAPVEIEVPQLDVTSVSISQSPESGSVTVGSDGAITYTPNQDFFGTDSFSYSVNDTSGNLYGTGRVNLDIEGVQDAPILTVTAPSSVTEGESVTVSASATDPDGDDVTITIDGVEQTSLTLTAPNRVSSSTIVIDVEASDGVNATSRTVSITVNARAVATNNTASDSGGGGALSWLSLLCLSLLFRRRPQK